MTDLPAIDWSLLGQAMEFFTRRGFTPVSLPWAVPTTSATHALGAVDNPKSGLIFRQIKVPGDRVMALTPEQGFADRDLQAKGDAEEGRFVACGPSMYVDDEGKVVGSMQVTLHQTDAVDDIALAGLLDIAADFARYHVPDPSQLTHERTDEGFALMYGGHVLGTFGIRSADGMAWISGTGFCEPIFSNAIK